MELLKKLIELNKKAIDENWKMEDVGEEFFKTFAYNNEKKEDILPDGVLWEKSKEYSKQFAIRDKPVQSEIAMNEAQDHYYRGMIASRDMLS